MNIAVQCCGLVVLLILFLFYIQKKKLGTRTQRVFRWIFFNMTLCLGMDILSVIMISKQDLFPDALVDAVCKSYLILLVLSTLVSLLYLYSDAIKDEDQWKKCIWFFSGFAAVVSVCICFAPIYIYSDLQKNVAYTYGPAIIFTYIGVSIMLLNNLYLLFSKQSIREQRRSAVAVWMFLWITAALIQFKYNDLLIVGFAGVLGVLVVYLQFENPELNLDKDTGAFNPGAYMEYMQQLYDEKKDYPVLSIRVYRCYDGRQEESVQTHVICQMARILLAKPHIQVFRVNEAELLILFHKKKDAAEYAKKIYCDLDSAFRIYGDNVFKAAYIYAESMQVVNTGSELLELMHFVRVKNGDLNLGRLLKVDEQTAEKLFHIKHIGHQITSAIENDRILVYYQPIYSLRTQRFTSAEALVRMIDDQGNMIMPNDFIRVAEENGQIRQLGAHVFQKVCRFFKEQRLDLYGMEYIEVNLSVVQAADENLASDFIRIMDEQHIDPKRINLEITESASVGAKTTLVDNMEILMERGVSFSLDDFGTGQSNLNYIVEMPVHIVKFDRGMTNAYFDNGKAKYVMDAAMHMIHGMGLSIVAEGIETEEQFKTMEKLGIQYIQGYFFSKPLSEQQFVDFIKEKNAGKAGGVA